MNWTLSRLHLYQAWKIWIVFFEMFMQKSNNSSYLFIFNLTYYKVKYWMHYQSFIVNKKLSKPTKKALILDKKKFTVKLHRPSSRATIFPFDVWSCLFLQNIQTIWERHTPATNTLLELAYCLYHQFFILEEFCVKFFLQQKVY